MTVNWTAAALTDLQSIESHFARRSPHYAQGVIDRIFDRTADLAAQPRFGAVVFDAILSEKTYPALTRRVLIRTSGH
jgi:plasmid stabilization system protein ParE